MYYGKYGKHGTVFGLARRFCFTTLVRQVLPRNFVVVFGTEKGSSLLTKFSACRNTYRAGGARGPRTCNVEVDDHYPDGGCRVCTLRNVGSGIAIGMAMAERHAEWLCAQREGDGGELGAELVELALQCRPDWESEHARGRVVAVR